MSSKPLYALLTLSLLAGCQEPAPGGALGKKNLAKASASQPASDTQPAEDAQPEDLTLDLDLEAASEPTPKAPEKSDPECEAQDAPGKSPLVAKDQEAVLNAYLDIQKDYFGREKGYTDFELTKDPKDPLSYQLRFKDLLGTKGTMTYKLGKTIVGTDDRVTLCLDEGNKLLWAGTYRRESNGTFSPDI